jgi:imidazolonepropionase-like amidohydrolase
VIKIMSTGGVLSSGDALSARQFSDEELHAIVDEATLLGLKVCCHAHGAAGIKAAVRRASPRSSTARSSTTSASG